MADKKEIFDYLRNVQKETEIEAKVNGINLWVLLGAIAIVTWQLLGSAGTGLWDRPELIFRTLLCAESLYLFGFFGWRNSSARTEVRYADLNMSETESPFLILLLGMLLLLPPVLSLIIVGKSWGSAILCFIGVICVGFGIAAIVSILFNLEANTEKFPNPYFEKPANLSLLVVLILYILFSCTIIEQVQFAWKNPGILTFDSAKHLTLLSALYLLILVTVQRKLLSNSIVWTYKLETELLLGTISPDIATRRIEFKALGPRLQDIMNRFFDDMDYRINELDSLFELSRSLIESVKEVPKEYGVEHASRTREATQAVSAHIDALVRDCSEFGRYLNKIEKKNTGLNKTILIPHLASLKARHKIYEKRLLSAKAEENELMS